MATPPDRDDALATAVTPDDLGALCRLLLALVPTPSRAHAESLLRIVLHLLDERTDDADADGVKDGRTDLAEEIEDAHREARAAHDLATAKAAPSGPPTIDDEMTALTSAMIDERTRKPAVH